jgi:hypothetical protein
MADLQLRFKRVDEGWWRAFHGQRIYDLHRLEAEGHFRAVILQRGRRDDGKGYSGKLAPVAERTFPLREKGAWTRARLWLNQDGPTGVVRRPVSKRDFARPL